MTTHVFTETELLSADPTDIQVHIHMLLQVLPTRKDLEAHLADSLPGREVRNHVTHVIMLKEGALVADGADVARHPLVHVGVEPELPLAQELFTTRLAGELLFLCVDRVVLPEVAALVETLEADAAEVLASMIRLRPVLQHRRRSPPPN